mgnify:CR=1 FL=1
MLNQFVPAEFTIMSRSSWLQQFRYALRVKDKQPDIALKYLVDMDYDRWKTICNQIEDIKEVAAAIEFLGNSLGSVHKRCLQPWHCNQKIERTIDVAKLAAIERRDRQMVIKIEQLKKEYSELSGIRAKYADEVQQSNKELQKLKHQSEIQHLDDRTKQRKSSLQKQIAQEYASQRETQQELKQLDQQLRRLRQYRTTIRPYPCI